MSYFSQMHTTHSVFGNRLIRWYLVNGRELPWRNTRDPYFIWLSEIIMQQTRVEQGLPYYLEFVKKFPDIHHLAEASEDDVLKAWQGLGYYTRARNLHHTAKYISEKRKGVFPENYDGLIRLKGVGDYTASAIASICYNQPEAVVDGNVFRVLSRIFGISIPINTGAGKKEFKNLARNLLIVDSPGDFNQALMDFGSGQCVPRNPDCQNCIFKNECFAFQNGRVHEFPVKLKSKPVRKRYFNYLIPVTPDNLTSLNQRKEDDIWKRLYEFPLIETSGKLTKSQLEKLEIFQEFEELWGIKKLYLFNRQPVIHKLSHQHIDARFWIITVSESPAGFISFSEIKNFAVPVLIENFINDFFKEF